MRREMIKVNGISLFYRDTGTDKQPLLCLHGKWGRGETWTGLMTRYHDRYRIIAPDQRGHGLSGRPAAGYDGRTLAEDALGLLKRLDPRPAIVVGHSMGARVAAHLAANYASRVKALVILDNTTNGPKELSEISPQDATRDDDFTADLAAPYATFDEAKHDISRNIASHFNDDFTDITLPYFLDSLIETVEGYKFMFSRYAMAAIGRQDQDWFDLLPKFKCPVWLVRASASEYLNAATARKMKKEIKHCTYDEISNTNHWVYLANPSEFYAKFDLFLNSL